MRLVLATNNAKKLIEMRAILESTGSGLELVSLADIGISVSPEETGTTFEENASIKALEVFKATGLPSIADDSGLCVEALGGEPGVHSARYGGFDHGPDALRNEYLLSRMENIDNRSAKFVCVIAFATSENNIELVRGELSGEITRSAKGDSGFGYDPLFYVPEHDMTAAEMPPELKNRISHRGRALAGFRHLLERYLEDINER